MNPFEADSKTLANSLDEFVEVVFSSLESEFLLMPRGTGFLAYSDFESAYEGLKKATSGFRELNEDVVFQVVVNQPIAVIVLRTILGFTPSELAYVAEEETKVKMSQGFVRTLDRGIRNDPSGPLRLSSLKETRIRALVRTACRLIKAGASETPEELLHRIDKADTKDGIDSLHRAASLGIPYAMLLYERFLGRPFAGHRDSVSELVGDVLEIAIEKELIKAGISYRKTKRAERLPGFDQAPDFVIPSEYSPQVVIEAKITEDDGTARDKVTRIQHLSGLSQQRTRDSGVGFEVIACIAGRGFRVRREDMKKCFWPRKERYLLQKPCTIL